MSFITCILLVISISDDRAVKVADSAFASKQYDTALIWYYYHEVENLLSSGMLAKMAFASYKTGDFVQAANRSRRSRESVEHVDMGLAMRELELFSQVMSSSNAALLQISRFQPASEDQQLLKNLLYARAWLNNDNIGRAETAIRDYCSATDCHDLKMDEPKEKNPVLAKWMSAILPGSGQMYGNDFRSAVGALGMNVLSAYLVGNAIREERYVDTALITSMLWYRYYKGNVKAAERSVRTYNLREQRRRQDSLEAFIDREIHLRLARIEQLLLHNHL